MTLTHRYVPFLLWIFCLPAFTGAMQPANAAEIHILSPGVTNAGIKVLAESFTQETGTVVTFTGGTVAKIKDTLATGAPADIVVLPVEDMNILGKSGAIVANSATPLGRIGFGLAVRTGAPHPDISTPEKFRAVLLAAQSVAYNDPASGSLGGAIIARILARPEYSGVKGVPGRGARAVADGTADMALQSMSELLPLKGVESAGYLPQELQAWMDFSAALTPGANGSNEAVAFLHYIMRPEAAAVWKTNGVDR